ncbi:peroxisomal membrane protein 2 [Thrips palmi]|uniref:Peroxisomal membrane protein 2 n=1 Tax=Thrips palmi TaxID=161013 RepID=A0A6P9A2W8_THRPL|nr:peroxisomal membrane protein 2 [Thrips palmi]XP_034252182.1 peroxisomal membrane protein 2 [Thrips palmi]XP_034252183.1 peroxisomal membrane protein 2 [Thrips palmi]
MSLSKSAKRVAYKSLESYFIQLYTNPLRTKSVTSAIIYVLGNYTSQRISGAKVTELNSLLSFGAYGLLFGGSIPHYFFQCLEWLVPGKSALATVKQLLIQRLIFTPLYQLFTLYTISRFEGRTHRQAVQQLIPIYVPVLIANWKWLTALSIINLTVVPPVLRVVFMNLVGFVWSIYLATKRRKASERRGGGAKGGSRPGL